MSKQDPLGSFEFVSFPDLGIKDVIAKIDTGAYTGALHATDIHETTDKDGRHVITFVPFGIGKRQFVSDFRQKRVKSSNGEFEERYVINTVMTIAGKERKLSIGLTDRTKMMKGVLIGRQFLRRYRYVVDVRRGIQHRYESKEDR